MTYKIERIGDAQLEPPVMDSVDMNYYGCSCGCDELFRMNQMYQCIDCMEYVANEHREIHKTICQENENEQER